MNSAQLVKRRILATILDCILVAILCTIVFYFQAVDLIYSPSAKEFSVGFAAAPFLEINSNTALFCWFLLCFFDALFLFLLPLGLSILSSVVTYSYPVEILRQSLLASILINFCYHFIFEFCGLRATPGKMLMKLKVHCIKKSASWQARAICILLRSQLKVISIPIALGLFIVDARNGWQSSALDNGLPHDKRSRTFLQISDRT